MAWLGALAGAAGSAAGAAGAGSAMSGLGSMLGGAGGAAGALSGLGSMLGGMGGGGGGGGMMDIPKSTPAPSKPTGGMGGSGQPGFARLAGNSAGPSNASLGMMGPPGGGMSSAPPPTSTKPKPNAMSKKFTEYVQNQLDVKGRMNDGTFNHQRVHARPLPPQAPVGQALIRQGARSGAVPVGSSIVAEILRQRMGVN